MSKATPGAAAGRVVGWAEILPHWPLVVDDLAAIHGLDLTDPAVWTRPWEPIRARIMRLPSEPTSRLRQAIGG